MKVRGRVYQRGKRGHWVLILDYGYVADAAGVKKRKLEWQKFEPVEPKNARDARRQAEEALAKKLVDVRGGTHVAKSHATLVDWLRAWLDKHVKVNCRPSTYDLYKVIVEVHVAKADIGAMPLQEVRASDVEQYLGSLKAARATVDVHHAVIRGALRDAKRDGLVAVNHAVDLRLPKGDKQARQQHARVQCWTAVEARAVLKAATDEGTQAAAFFALALDTGMRKGELLGLAWPQVDLDAGTVLVERTILSRRGEPRFGPTKTGLTRTVSIDPDTVTRLRTHRAAQAEVKMKNRTSYADHGLVFAREAADLFTRKAKLGDPMTTVLDKRTFKKVVKAAGVRLIKVHGMRHTVATLTLNAGIPVHEVAARLGHSKATMTLNTYAHALPTTAGSRSAMGAVLYG